MNDWQFKKLMAETVCHSFFLVFILVVLCCIYSRLGYNLIEQKETNRLLVKKQGADHATR